MRSLDNHSILDPFLAEPSTGLSPPRAIHRCLEHIWQRFHLRARLFLLEGNSLVLRDCVGEYRCCPEMGLRVHAGSLVWEIFRRGKPANLTECFDPKDRPHTLPEPVTIKAVFPLKGLEFLERPGGAMGVLVVDAGDSPRPIEDRDFQYLEVLGMLISEILERSVLMEKIRTIQREKDRMAGEVSHVFRNRFTVIGGFARKLTRSLEDRALRQYARIILKETAKGEKALKRWRKLHRKGKWEDESGYLC